MSDDLAENVAAVLGEHVDSGITTVVDERRQLIEGYRAWCYCGGYQPGAGATWNGTFNLPSEQARAELHAHLAAAVLPLIREREAAAWDEGAAAFDTWGESAANPYAGSKGAPECDHPGIDHSTWSYTGICPRCRKCKLIGHGPLCVDCLDGADQ